MLKMTWQKVAVRTLGVWLPIALISTLPPAFGNTKEIQLFRYVEDATPQDGLGLPVQTSERLKLARVGDVLVFRDAKKRYRILVDKREVHQNGDVSLLGKLENTDLLTVITRGATGSSGRIRTPDGDYTIRQYPGGERLITPTHHKQWTPLHGDDTATPPHRHSTPVTERSLRAARDAGGTAEQSPQRSTTGTDLAMLTVLVLWDRAFENAQGGAAGAQTKINDLITYSNRIFEDSKIYIKLRLAHFQRWQPAGYQNTQSSNHVLTNVLQGNAEVSGLRDTHLADFVVFVRQFSDSHADCGIAWVGSTDTIIKSHPFSIVHSGQGSQYECLDSAFPHEIGHNLGSLHDHSDPGASMGRFPYSYGHDTDCSSFSCSSNSHFATVMSTDFPRVDKFSNPRITCLRDRMCGVAEGNQNPADNARGFNAVRFIAEANRRLAAPATVAATEGTHAAFVRLTWSAVSGASDYQILRATNSAGTFTAIANTSAQTYNDVSAPHGQVFYYKVQACLNGNECGTESAAVRGYRQPFSIRDRLLARNTISEAAAADTTVSGLALELIDAETSNKIATPTWVVSFHTDVFAFETASGEFKLIRASLDYEITPSYAIQVSAAGSKGSITLTKTLTVTIHLQDVLESLDVVDSNSATNTISEHAGTGTSVSGLRLQALDEAMTPLSANWQITTPSGIFAIHGGIITLAKTVLNSTATPTYIVEVSATAQKTGGVTLTATQIVTIQVTNVVPLRVRLRLFFEGPLQ